MEKYINEHNKECWKGVTAESKFSADMFHVSEYSNEDSQQWCLFTGVGNLTVVDRMTGFGWRDTETGYRDPEGKFWLASGGFDVMRSDCKTVGEAIEWVKKNANTCIPE